jgi:cytoplasmic iron level regulating protein YaaA (DUF328/UPF0246 family)
MFMLILLSPSKTQDFETTSRIQHPTQPGFQLEIQALIQVLNKLKPQEIMSVSQKIADLNYDRFQNYQSKFTSQNSKPALEAFKGDVYQDIQVESYTSDQLKYAQDHLRIISGLYGLLRPLDLIQPYRLEMKTKLKNPKGKDLYEFWNTKITDKLNQTPEPIINLASDEYYKVIQPKNLKQPVYKINFKERKGDEYKIVAIHAKRARGAMTNFIIQNQLKDPEEIKEFKARNYTFTDKLSTENEFTFTRG